MKKYIVILLIIFAGNVFDTHPSDKARGIFGALGVGPRLPIGNFSDKVMLGYGFNMELSYTDNEYLPIFLFGRIGFEQYPGSQDFYQTSDYSHFSSNLLPVTVGARYYFPPILENIVIVIPLVEASASLTFFQELHEFKPQSLKNNYLEDGIKPGFNLGVGVSMFLLEVLASYNYLNDNQFLSVDLKIRLPLYVSI